MTIQAIGHPQAQFETMIDGRLYTIHLSKGKPNSDPNTLYLTLSELNESKGYPAPGISHTVEVQKFLHGI